MRILLGYHHYRDHRDVKTMVENRLARLRAKGMDIVPFVLTLNPPGPRLHWKELDARWRRGDRELLQMYETLGSALEGFDVFINWNGINVHPEFVRQLSTFNVYGCNDDPESSENLSRPVAAAYDLCLIGNCAELDNYRSWGVRHVEFWPLGFLEDDWDPRLTSERILKAEREVDVTILCEREMSWRRDRLDQIARAFPQGRYHGRGWPNGSLPEAERVSLYQRTKIGFNVHNSTGPINFRTYGLPANGVMQICDNKSHLGKIFELNREVVGFDTIAEGIDMCRFYLEHDEARRKIAAAGFERVCRDYNEEAVFRLVEKYVCPLMMSRTRMGNTQIADDLKGHRRQTVLTRLAYHCGGPSRLLKRMASGVKQVCHATLERAVSSHRPNDT